MRIECELQASRVVSGAEEVVVTSLGCARKLGTKQRNLLFG